MRDDEVTSLILAALMRWLRCSAPRHDGFSNASAISIASSKIYDNKPSNQPYCSQQVGAVGQAHQHINASTRL